ncbi:hypothetical protein [Pseudomonas alkylphenolica]|uniref:hypothetical protein n=1 Tax=Pseudomonas alkylphenolica TaxID=237609 RepID=UPI00315DB669
MATPNEAILQLIKTMSATGVAVEVKAAAAEGLGYAGGVAARDALIKVINSTGISVEVKAAAAKALGRAVSVP